VERYEGRMATAGEDAVKIGFSSEATYPYFPSIYDPRIIVEIEDMSYFSSIYDPSIIVEIENMTYFPSIYNPRIIGEIEDMSYFH
jgi:hypothetical protein